MNNYRLLFLRNKSKSFSLIFIIIILLSSNYSFAQSYQEQKDSLFQHLDKSKVTTGVLYDRVYPWVDLNVVKDSTFQISYSFIKQAWLELYLASYNNETFISIEEVKDKILTNTLNDKGITLGYLDFKFNSIDTNAFDNGSLYIDEEDSLLHDGEGNPYHHHHITYPLVSTQSLHGDYAKIYFDPSIYLSNTNRVIERINITLPNNKNKMFFPNDIDSIFIGDIQDSLILASVDIYFSGSRTPESSSIAWLNGNYTMMTYQYNENKCYENDTLWSGTDLKFKGYDEGIETQGFGEYRIFYRKLNDSWDVCADNIVKPVIIIDGFDPGDEREIVKVDNKDGIWDMLKFKDGGDFPVSRHLGDSLRSLGYDVIVLNFPEYIINGINRDGGADYIERNAMVLIRLIQKVNEELVLSGSEEEIVVIGPSMGGQIARYALAYMEKEDALGTDNMNHNTRLYVSFDSPHLGANIPLSLQRSIYALGYGLNHLDAKHSYTKQLRSKAARQMLIEQMNGLNKTSSFFLNYYSDLYSNGLAGNDGWPVNLKKVALINGVADGNKTGTENINIFNVEIKPSKVVHIQAKSMPQYQNVSSPFYAKIQGRVMPDSLSDNSLVRAIQILLAPKATFTSYVQNLNANGSMDVVPGGLYKTGLELYQQLKDAVDKNGSGSIHKHFVKETHTFIPSISALAFKERHFNWSDSFDERNLVCTNEIPFDNYFVAEENEEHIFISEKAAAWVLEEIEKGQPDCPTRCKREQPIYNDFAPLCINETRIINHNYDLPYGVNTTWSSESPHALEIVFQNNHTAVVKGINNMLDAKLKYTIHNPCGANIEGVFSIDIGIQPGGLIVYPETPIIIGGTPLVNYAKIEYYRPESNDYYWKLGEGGSWQEALNEHCPFTFTIQSHYDPNLSRIYLKTVNNCGEVIEEAYPWMQSAPLAAKLNLSSIIAYPNPSSGDWNVQFTNLTDRQLFLYDYMGKLVWHSTVTDLNTIIPGQQLTTGVYLLKILSKSEENTIKLIKQ